MGDVINLADCRAGRERQQGGNADHPRRVFRASDWAMDDYRMLDKHLSSLATMIGGGSLVDPMCIGELLFRYSVNAAEAAKGSDALLTRAVTAERELRKVARSAKRTPKPLKGSCGKELGRGPDR